MIDIKKIRENPDAVKEAASLKGDYADVDSILKLDVERRDLLDEVQALRATRNTVSEQISLLKKDGQNADDSIKEMREVSGKIKDLDEDLRDIEEKLSNLLLTVPNIPHESVPIGKDESDNKFVRDYGEKLEPSFELKDHLQLGESLRILDFAAGSKITGSGFPLYLGDGARLERALINFMLDVQTLEHGYTETFPPFLVNEQSARTTGNLPKFAEDMYHAANDSLFLIPTAEVPVTNIHRDEILSEDVLPISYAAYSACFRREAGSYGKDTRGFLRVHQFNKVELVKFVKPEDSYDALETIVLNAEEIMKRLGLHYRVVALATGDLSFAAAKCYDLEVWAPGEGKFLEVSSCSNFEDFQARRGNIRFRREESNKVEFVHTLNGSGLATSRLIVALMETYQTEEGDILIPEVLVPYFGKDRISKR